MDQSVLQSCDEQCLQGSQNSNLRIHETLVVDSFSI